MRGGIAERGGVRVGHRIIEINGQSVVATAHEKIVQALSNSVGEVKLMHTNISQKNIYKESHNFQTQTFANPVQILWWFQYNHRFFYFWLNINDGFRYCGFTHSLSETRHHELGVDQTDSHLQGTAVSSLL